MAILEVRKALQYTYGIRAQRDQVAEDPILVNSDSFSISQGRVKGKPVPMDISQ